MKNTSTSVDCSDLQAALSAHDIDLPDSQCAQLASYATVLWDWNTRLNLTRHTNLETFVTRDVLDSLRLAKHLPEKATVLDVGSGGGVPGIILAILRPDLAVSMSESVGKKAKALTDIVRRLRLTIPVYAERAEKVLSQQKFDALTIRAVASMRKLAFWFRQHPDAFDQILLIKGHRWQDEYQEALNEGLAENLEVKVLEEYPTPGHDHHSVILSVRFGDVR